jgi:uncharacterized membrane protein YkvA (DUF1232 family)
LNRLKVAHQLKRDIVAPYLAAKDPRTPWYAKALVICIVAYALRPIDLIPDLIPVLGFIDELLLLTLGIYFVMKSTPAPALTDCRKRAASMDRELPESWIAAMVIILIWITAAAALAIYIWPTLYEAAKPAVLRACAALSHKFSNWRLPQKLLANFYTQSQ